MVSNDRAAAAACKLIYIMTGSLWLIILLPKEIQFVLFFALPAAYMIMYRRFVRISRITAPFLAYAAFHLISVAAAVLRGGCDTLRILAALNTCGIWVAGVLAAGIKTGEKSPDKDRIGRYCAVNIFILFFVFLLTYPFPGAVINNFFEIRSAWTGDILLTGETVRFSGFFEYPALVSFFTLLQFPWAFAHLAGKDRSWLSFLLIPAAGIPVLMTYSRTGTALNILMFAACIVCFALSNGISAGKVTLTALSAAAAVLVIAGLCGRDAGVIIDKLINLRPGSNSDRMSIYRESIGRIRETSLLIGAGVKDMNRAGVYPLGSHSTYLGFVYKSGILGTLCALSGIIITFLSVIRADVKDRMLRALIIVMYVLLGIFCLTEDIDGADWLLVTVMVFTKAYLDGACGRPQEPKSQTVVMSEEDTA
ncbi:MAG: hypothetical protein K6F34_02540 [Lachnospiraceae bacterium]|nr:hypothetical protein [Lachnospiraceae bacterium]